MSAPEPIRRYLHPAPQEDWDSLVRRASAFREAGAKKEEKGSPASAALDLATLQSWNLHLALRPPSIAITPTDIVFVDPPLPSKVG